MSRAQESRPVLLSAATAVLVLATAASLAAAGSLVLDAAGGRMAHWVRA